MTVDPGTAALMLSTVTAVPAIMGAFADSPSTVATTSQDPRTLHELRRGELVGAGVSIVVATALASVVADQQARTLILAAALLMIAVYVAEHERALRRAPVRGDLATTPGWT